MLRVVLVVLVEEQIKEVLAFSQLVLVYQIKDMLEVLVHLLLQLMILLLVEVVPAQLAQRFHQMVLVDLVVLVLNLLSMELLHSVLVAAAVVEITEVHIPVVPVVMEAVVLAHDQLIVTELNLVLKPLVAVVVETIEVLPLDIQM
jgi:hypothetical protein